MKPYSSSADRPARIQLRDVPVLSFGSEGKVEVLVDGKPIGTAPTGSTLRPVPCLRPGGVAGQIDGAVDGAYLVITHLGVAAWPGFRSAFDGTTIRGVMRNGSVLLMNDDQPPSQEAIQPNHAWLDRRGRSTEIGPADDVWPLSDGSVLGRAFRNPKSGYSNFNNQSEGAQPETFLWRRGRRRSIGSWWPMDVSPQGVALGFRDGRRGARMNDDDRFGALVRWEKGRLAPLDLGGRSGCLPIVARADGSFVLGLVGKEGLRLAILRGKRLEVLPKEISGRTIDPARIEVDAVGRIALRGRDDQKWQVVRS